MLTLSWHCGAGAQQAEGGGIGTDKRRKIGGPFKTLIGYLALIKF